VLKPIWCTLVGGVVGGVLGILATYVITELCVLLSPGDPSAGSVGIIIIYYLPTGIIAGLVFGLLACNRARARGVAARPVVRRRRVFIILGLLVGLFGAHNFYAGYFWRGTAQLLVTLFLAPLMVGVLITVVWAVIDLLRVRCDADGKPFT
jgi:TM2 domain-containing membrane protein YozV